MQKFTVEGMTCAHCERAVTAAVHGLDPGATVQVDLAGGAVSTDSTVPAGRLVEAIRDAGYGVRAA